MGEVEKFDIVVIGAGVVGLAIAQQLSFYSRSASSPTSVLVVEKESSFGQHTSSRNSEIIHSGIYYPKDTLKTKMCVGGNRMMYNFLSRYNIPHNRCGKLIVATSCAEARSIERLFERGKENGVSGIEILNAREISKIEPNVKAMHALHVPSAGIVDSHALMSKLEQKAQDLGAVFSYNTEVESIKKQDKGYLLNFKQQDVAIEAGVVVNAAGLWSDKVAQMVGIDNYRLYFSKGEYYKTSKYKSMSKLIYPVPDPSGKHLGIHTVIDLEGNLSFGPNAYYVDELDYNINESNKEQFHKAINRYLPIDYDSLSPSMTGIRPKLQKENEHFKDFVIKNEEEKGYNNFINLVGVESPGLTSCLAIAIRVKECINE